MAVKASDQDGGIKNITEEEVPETRIASAQSARTLLQAVQVEDGAASEQRALIQGMIDGNPPFTEQQLKEANQEGAINVNWGHAEDKIETAQLPYFHILTGVKYAATVKTLYGRTEHTRDRNSRIITEEFHRMLSRDKSRLANHQLVQSNVVTHGTGCLVFRDGIDWHSKSIPPWNILPPKKAGIDWMNWEFCFILDELYTEELFRITQKPERAAKLGWKIANCKQAIIEADNVPKDKFRPWEEHQRELKDNGLLYSFAKSRTIKIAHLFVREYSGKISHYVFDRLNEVDWLCVDTDTYTDFKQALSMFISGVGNGDYAGVRGLGRKVYKYAEAMNRVNNALLEGVLISSAVMLQAETPSDVEKLEALTIGPWRVLPPGLRASPLGNLTPNLSSAMQVAGYFQSQEASQISSHMPSMAGQLNGQQQAKNLTDTTGGMLEGDQASLTSTRAEIYMQALDIHYEEVLRRASNPNLLPEDPGGKEALLFQQRCKARGVPLAALKDIDYVQATRTIGQGSPAARKAAMGEIMGMSSMLPEQQRTEVIRDTIAAIGGQQFVDKYGPKNENQFTGVDASIASLENNAFLQGGQTVIDPNQNHYIHANLHMQFFDSLIQALQGGQVDPHVASKALQSGGPHMMAHVKFVGQDPTRGPQFNALNQKASELMKMADQVEAMVERMDEEQSNTEQNQAPDPKMLVAQKQIELATETTQADIKRKDIKNAHDMHIKDVKTAQELQIAKIKAKTEAVSKMESKGVTE